MNKTGVCVLPRKCRVCRPYFRRIYHVFGWSRRLSHVWTRLRDRKWIGGQVKSIAEGLCNTCEWLKLALVFYRGCAHRTSVGFITFLAAVDVLAMFERDNVTRIGLTGEWKVCKWLAEGLLNTKDWLNPVFAFYRGCADRTSVCFIAFLAEV